MAEAPAAPMLGRRSEMTALRRAFDDGQAGRVCVVLVRGDPGVGKSRLVEEFIAALPPQPHLPVCTAVSRCVPAVDACTPFAAARRMLRALQSSVGTERFWTAAAAAGAVAGLRAVFPDQDAASARDDAVDAIARLLTQLGRDLHVVPVIDGAQWADESTLGVLHLLAGGDGAAHLTAIVTLRPEDASGSDAARTLLTELPRLPHVRVLDLTPLGTTDALVLLRTVNAGLGADDSVHIMDRAEGSPYLLLQQAAADGHAALPVPHATAARLTALTESARRVVSTAGVAGRHVPYDVLQRVIGATGEMARPAMDVALREAMDRGVLVGDADGGGVGFGHARMRDAALTGMQAAERARLHRAYAEVLAAAPYAHSADLIAAAEHRRSAGDDEAAFTLLVAAWKQAGAGGSPPHVAAQAADLLLELWDAVDDPGARVGCDAATLALHTARSWNDMVAPERALHTAQLACTRAADSAGEAAAQAECARAWASTGRPDEAHAAFTRARATLTHAPASPAVHAQSMLLRMLAVACGDGAGAGAGVSGDGAAVQDALDEAARTGDRALRAVAHHAAAVQAACDDRLADARDHARAMADVCAPDDIAALLTARSREGGAQVALGHYAEAVDTLRAGLALAQRCGWSSTVRAQSLMLALADALLQQGRADDAAALLRSHREQLPEPHRSCVAAWAARAQSWSGMPGVADDDRRARSDIITALASVEPQLRAAWAQLDMEGPLNDAEGDASPTADAVTTALHAAHALDDPVFQTSPAARRRLLAPAARAVTTARRTHVAAGEARAVQESIDRWSAALPDDDNARGLNALIAAERARADGDDAQPWRDAVGAADAGHIPSVYRGYARFRLAQALRAERRDGDQTRRTFEGLVQGTDGYGTHAIVQWVRAAEASAHRPPLAAGGLTAREAEVLTLVAQGLTNPEIGGRLFISPKTASVHVSAILAKLGAANRAEAAAWFTRRGA